MLEHDAPNTTHAEDASGRRQSLRNLSGNRIQPCTRDSDPVSKPVEDYLDHVIAPMVGSVPFDTRQELRRELRAHIAQLIAAHEELGSDNDEATIAALRQFGPPSVVSRKWMQELPFTKPEAWCREPAAASAARTASAAAGRLAAALGMWVFGIVFFDNYITGPLFSGLYLTLGGAIAPAVGFAVGRKYPGRRPVLGTLLAQTAILPSWPFLMMFLGQAFRHMQPEYYRVATMLGVVSFAALAPLGCLGAWLGARTRIRRRSRPRAAVR